MIGCCFETFLKFIQLALGQSEFFFWNKLVVKRGVKGSRSPSASWTIVEKSINQWLLLFGHLVYDLCDSNKSVTSIIRWVRCTYVVGKSDGLSGSDSLNIKVILVPMPLFDFRLSMPNFIFVKK